jgi:hypothetical protein
MDSKPRTPLGGAASRREWGLTIAAAFAISAAYLAVEVPLSNIDDYNILPFGRDYLAALWSLIASDAGNGRARPLYWILEGALGAATGTSGTVLLFGRLTFLVGALVLLVRTARALGAPPWLAVLLAASVGWSLPAKDTWARGGPAEAFAVPLALLATWLVLRAESARHVALAGLVGLAAACAKESMAPWTAAALLAWGFASVLSGGPWRARGIALLGAATQLLPALVALATRAGGSTSYLEYVAVSLNVGPLNALRAVADRASLAALLAVAGLAAVGARLARRAPREWARADLVVLACFAAVALEGVTMGFAVDRYHLPFVVTAALLAARAAHGWEGWPRARSLAAGFLLLGIPVLALMGYRTYLDVRLWLADSRADARLRELVATGLRMHGGLQILWPPPDVECAIGAIAHLRAAGVVGDVQLLPCGPYPAGAEKMYAGLFAPYSRPAGGAGPRIVATGCLQGQGVPSLESVRFLVLPSLYGQPVGRYHYALPEKAIVSWGR